MLRKDVLFCTYMQCMQKMKLVENGELEEAKMHLKQLMEAYSLMKKEHDILKDECEKCKELHEGKQDDRMKNPNCNLLLAEASAVSF